MGTERQRADGSALGQSRSTETQEPWPPLDRRFDEMVAMLTRMLVLDFRGHVTIAGCGDILDTLGHVLNCVSDELRHQLVERDAYIVRLETEQLERQLGVHDGSRQALDVPSRVLSSPSRRPRSPRR